MKCSSSKPTRQRANGLSNCAVPVGAIWGFTDIMAPCSASPSVPISSSANVACWYDNQPRGGKHHGHTSRMCQSHPDRDRAAEAVPCRLATDAWTKPSACALWEIRDVVAHVKSGCLRLTRTAITRGLQGDISPRPGAPDQSSVFHTHSQEERQQYRTADSHSDPSRTENVWGNDLVSVFSQGWDPFPPFIASLSAEDWHKPCHHSFGLIPVHARVHAGRL